MIVYAVAISVVVVALGYRFYSVHIARRLEINDARVTPACRINDGLDYVPARKTLLLPQHFSAIAAAGPIVGPILAGIWFGWLPALLWILLGSIFIGGTHDFTSLVASMRHKATSIGELARAHMSRTAQIIYLLFVWLALIYVIIAFTDVTALTFKTAGANEAYGPGVAVCSLLYLAIGIGLGALLRRRPSSLKIATGVALAALGLSIWWGTVLPAPLFNALSGVSAKTWKGVILAYCFFASLLPMWLLLQPRGYLGGWFLYLAMGVALFGAIFGGFHIKYPALNLEGFHSATNASLLLIPTVFITVACGACSGFHAIVSGGTTSKQVAKETDARPVAYGSMALEAIVAVLALATVMALAKGDALLAEAPNTIFAKGLSSYLAILKIDPALSMTFALLAFSTFVYDTLDVCTRLARYILQELIGWKTFVGAVVATLVSLALPFAFLMASPDKAYLKAWTIFGISNQLLASLTLLAVSIWLIRTGRKALYAILPMIFMMFFTLWALALQIGPVVAAWRGGGLAGLKMDAKISGVCSIVLLVLSLWLIVEAARVLYSIRGKGADRSDDEEVPLAEPLASNPAQG